MTTARHLEIARLAASRDVLPRLLRQARGAVEILEERRPRRWGLAWRGPFLIATKLEAFVCRGGGDYLGSRDFADVVSLLDGRAEIIDASQTRAELIVLPRIDAVNAAP